MEAFYQEGRDHVLNLNDARCESWSVFNDCETQSEFDAAAAALIPGDHGSDGGFWELAARTLFVDMCVELKRVGRGRTKHLYHELLKASTKRIFSSFQRTADHLLVIQDPAPTAEHHRAATDGPGSQHPQ